jgi:hypothetical protein
MTLVVGLLLGAIIGAMGVMIIGVHDEQKRSMHRLGMRNRNQSLAPGEEENR